MTMLPLHNDLGTVTDSAFEEQLELVRARVALPLEGVFGPSSMTWRVNREAFIFLAAGRALLLQLAHPWIATAIRDHSRALDEPISRFHRTFNIVFALVFGSVDQAFAAARRLHQRHSLITGSLPTAIGPFKAGSRYYANNISALSWVHATLIESALTAHELIFDRLTCDERTRYYSESRRFAGMFGIPQDLLPGDYNLFLAYIEAMRDSDILTVGDDARMIAQRIFARKESWLSIPVTYRALTSDMLPERLRRDFALSYGDAEHRAGQQFVKWLRRAYPVLPARVRYVAPYQEATERLAGEGTPRILTRFLNRLWIGRPSL